MEIGYEGRLTKPSMFHTLSTFCFPRKSIKLGLILGFGFTIVFLLNQSSFHLISPIHFKDIYNDDDVRLQANLCQPLDEAFSNNTYACLGTRPLRLPAVPSEPPRLPYTPLPQSCLDAHFATGAPCSGEGAKELDVVWIWANGSDPLFQDAIEAAESTSWGLDTKVSKVGLSRGAKLYRYDAGRRRYQSRF